MGGVLSEVQESCSSKLFFNNQSLFQKFEPSCQKFVLDFQKVTFSHIHLKKMLELTRYDIKSKETLDTNLKRLVDDGEPHVVLDVLPPAVAVADYAGEQPVVVTPEHKK